MFRVTCHQQEAVQDLFQWLAMRRHLGPSEYMARIKVIFVTDVLFRSWRGYLHDTRSEAARVIIGMYRR